MIAYKRRRFKSSYDFFSRVGIIEILSFRSVGFAPRLDWINQCETLYSNKTTTNSINVNAP